MSGTQTADPAPTPAPTPPTTPPAAATPSSTPTFQSPAQGEAERLIAEQRETRMRELEEKALKADNLQKQLDEYEKAKLAEEKKFRELYEGEKTAREKQAQEHRQALARAELKALAISEGIIDADLVSLVKTPPIADGEDFFTALRDAFKAFKESKPQLFKRVSGSAPATTATTGEGGEPPPQNTAPKTIDVTTMNKADYAKYKRKFLYDARR